ncbi:MAG: shikimate kinase [Candidatus Cryptobacteroides sp.]
MIIALTGIMGSGKSSVGRELRALHSCSYIDLDDYIEAKEGCSISSIFAEKGEAAFRTIEADYLREIIDTHHNSETLVLSLGGGTVTNPDSARLVYYRTFCIFLTAAPETVAERLFAEASRRSGLAADSRPILHGAHTKADIAARISDLLSKREASYRAISRHIIPTDSLSQSEIAETIHSFIFNNSFISSCHPK